MMKYFYLAALMAISPLYAWAQPRITIGKPYAVIDANDKTYFTEKGQILTIKMDKKDVILQKLNAVDLTFQKITLYDDFPKESQIEKITKFNGRYFVFYSLYDDEKENLVCREIDFARGTFKDKGKSIITVDQKITGSLVRTGFMSTAVADKFDFFFSYDSTSMVVQYRVKPEKRNDSKSYDVIGMHVFDKDLIQKWSNKVKMPYTEKRMDNLDYSVDAKGNVYIVTRVFNDNTTDMKKRGEDEANYHLEVLKIIPNANETTSTTIEVTDKFINTMWLYESVKGYMVCAGFYNKGKYSANVDGIALFKLSPEGRFYGQKFYEIPLEVLNQYTSAKTARKNDRKDDKDKAEFESLVLHDVIIQDDESVVLIGEQQFMLTHASTLNGRTSYYYSYHANDMLITKISPEGKLAWMKKLPKRQTSGAGFRNMSYRYFNGQTNHYFLFLDNEKNTNLEITEVPAQHMDGQGGFMTIYQIDDRTGTTKRMSLLDTRDVNGMELYQVAPYRVMATGPGTLVFEAYKKKKDDVLIKIALD